MSEERNPLRDLPSVSTVLASAPIQELVDCYGHRQVVSSIRGCLNQRRQRLQQGQPPSPLTLEQLVGEVAEQLHRLAAAASLRPVINATGILLHTGLGRAPLASQAIAAINDTAAGYASVELDLSSGQRGDRMRCVSDLLCQLTGAEAALVVNNNAAATMLVLASMAAGREVIVSRGELIEIGGQFRLPDIMSASGAVLREVGTTNRTRLADYAEAIDDRTAALLLVHSSNYRIVGFTEQVPLAELVRLGRDRQLPVVHDVGSGALIDFSRFGFRDEPLVSRSLQQGADVVLFSGDKLLGGPQCGVILGSRPLVGAMSRHPLARALRVDKLTLAALAATLNVYRDPAEAQRSIPLLRLLGAPLSALRERAEAIAAAIRSAPPVRTAEVIDEHGFMGGGSMPAQQQPSVCVAIEHETLSVDRLASRLRDYQPAILGRIRSDRLLLDLRTVFPAQDPSIIAALRVLSA